MDHERKELLAQKKAQFKVKQQREDIQQYKNRLTKSIEDFSQKYRYADEDVYKRQLTGLATVHPHLKELRLWGAPGNLGNFSAVGGFRELTNLSTFDLFGFGAPQSRSSFKMCIRDSRWRSRFFGMMCP